MQEVDRFWEEPESSKELQASLSNAGLDPQDLQQLDQRQLIKLYERGSGFDPGTVALVVAFAPLANKVGQDLWTRLLLPRIRRRWGVDAIGPEAEDD
jgi:hypothetical protein